MSKPNIINIETIPSVLGQYERRVFHVDVGDMSPQRTKQYLENIKNEIRLKKLPSEI